MRADIVAGALFPDYELTDHTGKHRKLSDLQGPDPMILVLSRGGYCPKDRRQAEGLVQLHHEMEVGYSRLVTISTDNMLLTNEYRTGVGAHWTFLSDPGRKVQKDLDIAEYTDPEHNPMIPHRPRTWSRDIQDLQRLLVFWPTDHRRASSRLAYRVEEMPSGLGHH
jgi:peroxiredoxin